MSKDKKTLVPPSLLIVLWQWYVRLSLVKKIVYVVGLAGLYLASVLIAVGAYWLKTDLNYNILKDGGWHTFAQCVKVGLELDK